MKMLIYLPLVLGLSQTYSVDGKTNHQNTTLVKIEALIT